MSSAECSWTDEINKATLEIAQAGDETYDDLNVLADDLPGHSPRYILLSYPLTLVGLCCSRFLQSIEFVQASGRASVPYVLIYYLPVTANAETKMLYAGAKELMRNTAQVGRVIEIQEAEDLESIEERLGGEQ